MKKYFISIYLFCLVFLSLPPNVFAATVVDYEISWLGVLNSLVSLLVGAAVAFFFWGLVTFIQSADNPEAHEDAKGRMIYGIVAITVMVSLWGLVGILSSSFSLNNTKNVKYDDLIKGKP